MAEELKRIPDFDDIIFDIRNKDYGAYRLRKKYSRTVIISLLIGIVIMTTASVAPFLNAKVRRHVYKPAERQVYITVENLDKPVEMIPPAPPPAPPSAENVIRQFKYVAPVVVDTVKPQESSKLITADETQTKVNNNKEAEEVVPAAREEVLEQDAEAEPFFTVEEMPVPEGGESGLYAFIARHTKYPKIALENNVQGKVYVKFCVTSKGTIDQVSIFKGVDPELNAEAIRVVNLLPPFKPGKMNAKPVPVWYIVHIDFLLQ
jgi:periplasmic protein TonB